MTNMDTELAIGVGIFLLITIGPAVGYAIAAIIAKFIKGVDNESRTTKNNLHRMCVG